MKRIKYIVLSSVLAFSALISGCVNQYEDSSTTIPSENNEDIRLVITSPAIAEITDKLELEAVGICDTSFEIPKRYENVEKIGYAMSPDLEIVKSLNPDYVLSPLTLIEDLQPKYASIQVKSLFLNLKSVDGLYSAISDLGKILNRDEQAQRLVDEYSTFINEYKEKNKDKVAPKVLILMGLPGSYVVATEHSYAGSLVKLAGGINVYEDETAEFINANTEDMKAKDPDIILRTAHALPDRVMEMFAEEFETNDVWKHFRAVKENKVYDLSYERFGMSAKFNYPQALEELQEILYS
ncbi:MAG: heme ABC transporter substrate-binding protein IsdE [Clostridiales bacterium]|nr:heme ABC transporter substrate-binding protein IsdE [Clostridiales bacterium]